MEFTRQRHKKNNVNDKYIVHSEQNLVKKIISYFINVIMWCYMLVVLAFFIGAFLNLNGEQMRVLKSILKVNTLDIQRFIGLSCVFFIISFAVLYFWKFYNIKKFGHLNRRKMPTSTSKQDMLSLNLITPEVYSKLQTERAIVLEENPVSELYKGDI